MRRLNSEGSSNSTQHAALAMCCDVADTRSWAHRKHACRPNTHSVLPKLKHSGASERGHPVPLPSFRARAASASFFCAFIAAAVAFLESFSEVAIQAGPHTDLAPVVLLTIYTRVICRFLPILCTYVVLNRELGRQTGCCVQIFESG